MDEKKLTDEEIVKALECCINSEGCDCGNCPYINNDDCQNRSGEDLLDLIHRLQDENGKLKKLVSHFEQLEKALSAEIERLTKWKDKLQDTKDELEQQLIDTGFKEYCEENKRLTEENAELQKQVDELKEQFLSTCENCHLKKDLELLRYQKEQAVKDTAREIYDKIEETWLDCHTPYVLSQAIKKWIKEKYGVEVE